MNRLAQLCLGIIGIPFLIVGISYIMNNTQTSSVGAEQICVYEIIQSGSDVSSPKGIGSYRKDGIWVTAYHVVGQCRGDCYLHTASGDVLLRDIRRWRTGDIVLFRTDDLSHCQPVRAYQDVLITIASGVQQMVPIVIKDTTIPVQTTYGQSGSPVYDNDVLIGVVSQRSQDASLVELLPLP